MNKQELIDGIADKADIPKDLAGKVLNAVLDTIKDALAANDQVVLIGFGTFKISDRKARTGRNPQTGEELKIAASKTPTFKAGKALKDAVN